MQPLCKGRSLPKRVTTQRSRTISLYILYSGIVCLCIRALGSSFNKNYMCANCWLKWINCRTENLILNFSLRDSISVRILSLFLWYSLTVKVFDAYTFYSKMPIILLSEKLCNRNLKEFFTVQLLFETLYLENTFFWDHCWEFKNTAVFWDYCWEVKLKTGNETILIWLAVKIHHPPSNERMLSID